MENEIVDEKKVEEQPSLMDLAAAGEITSLDQLAEFAKPDDSNPSDVDNNPNVKQVETIDDELKPVVGEGGPDLDKIAEIKAKMDAEPQPEQTIQPTAQPSPTPNASAPVVDLPKAWTPPVMPEAIQPPNVPVDAMDRSPEQQKVFDQYIFDKAEHDKSMVTYFSQLGEGFGNMQEVVSEVNRIKDVEAQRAQDSQQKQQSRDYWDGISDFQKTNDVFNTSKDVKTARTEAIAYEDTIAALSGVTNTGDVDLFNQQVNLAMELLEAGDPDLLAKVSEAKIVEPEDYQAYKNITELDSFKAKAIADKSLGANATLEDAYALSRFRAGDFQTALETTAVDATTTAAKDISKVIRDAQNTVKTPSQASQGATTVHTGIKQIDDANLTAEELVMLEESNKDMSLLSDPNYRAVFLKTQNK